MKYNVSVVKRIALLMMTMALAVALVACQGAAGTPGPAGPPGPPGDPAPTTPTDPTTPTEPTVTNAPPTVTTAFKPVYLALAGTGKKTSYTVADLNKHITDADSALRFGASSSAAKVATAKVDNNTLTITATGAGSAMVTVTANDGANPALEAMIAVTVVKTNAAPTTNGLSKADRDNLQKDLYIADGTKSFTVTIISLPGPASDSFEDAIVDDYKVEIGDKAKTTDDYVIVTVKKGTGNKHVINVTPKSGTNGKSVDVKVYPKDKFGATPSDAWTFKATINTIPKVLVGSLGDIDLSRTATASIGAATASIDIGRYFDTSTLDRMFHPRETDPPPDTLLQPMVPGDTTCVVNVSPSTNAFHVQKLNTRGLDSTETSAGDDGVQDEGDITAAMLMGSNALAAIVIDSRYSSYGTPDLRTTTPVEDVGTTPADESVVNDIPATGTGSFTLTITCTDPDGAASVTGTVVIRA